MNLLHYPILGALLAAPLVSAQTTVFHFRVNDTDAAGLPTIPSVGGSPGTAQVPFTGVLSADVPTVGVPPGAGNRSIVGAADPNSAGVNSANIDEIDNAKIIANGGFTYETWFKYHGGGNVNAIIDYAGTEKLRIQGGLGIDFPDGSGFTVIDPAPTLNEWHYVAVVFTHDGLPEVGGRIGGTLTYYYDTNLHSVTVPAGKGPFGDSLNRVIGVGRHPLGFAGDDFSGLVYEPRVTLGALRDKDLLFTIAPDSDPSLLAIDSITESTNGTAIAFDIPLRNAFGTSLNLNISNVSVSGTHQGDFVVTSFDPLVEADGGRGNIRVDFTPSSGDGIYEATLTIHSNDPLKPSFDIELSVDVRDPIVQIDAELDFGTFLIPTSEVGLIRVENLGGVSDLELSNPRFIGEGAAAYSINSALPVIPAGNFADIEVRFAPTTGGAFPAELLLDTNDPRNPEVSVSLDGFIQDPQILIPDSVPFGALANNPGQQTQSLLVDNFGQTQDLVIGNPRITGPAAANYSIPTSFPIEIPAGGFAEILFDFDPETAGGSFLAVATFDTNDPLHPTVTVKLTATVAGTVDLEGPSKVSHWTFDDPAALGHDSGGFGYHGTVVGEVEFSKRATVGGGAISLPGTADYISVPIGAFRYEELDDDGEGFTIATWVCSSSAVTNFTRQRYFSKLGGDAGAFGVGQDTDTRLLATTYGIVDFVTGPDTLPPQDEWHHVAYVFTGSPISGIKFYVDGVLISSVTGNQGLATSIAPAFAIGGVGGNAGEWFDGMLDDLRVYAVELNAEQIAELAAMGTVGPPPGDSTVVVTSVERVNPEVLRIEFLGEPNTLYQVRSSPDLATSQFTGSVTPVNSGLTTDGTGEGFVEVPISISGSLFYQIQQP
jgi:hypothetical protein